jgi:hypothetical protein
MIQWQKEKWSGPNAEESTCNKDRTLFKTR